MTKHTDNSMIPDAPRFGTFLASTSRGWNGASASDLPDHVKPRVPAATLTSRERRGSSPHPPRDGAIEASVNADLLRWVRYLCDYATDWDRKFNARSGYFTQEYWSLFVGCVMRHWSGSPVTMSEACQLMLTGSNRTREDRIKRAVLDGFLVKQRSADSGRNAFVIPTPQLEQLMHEHLTHTLQRAREALLP